MAVTLYEDLLPEIIPMVPGCPDSLIETYVRSALIELCEKAGVYQRELDPVTTVANLYEYDLEPPDNTVVDKILWVVHKGKDLEAITTGLLERRKPKWRDSDRTGEPEYFIKASQKTFFLVPVPNETIVSSTVLRVQLKPTITSVSCDTEVMTDYRDTIVNGALLRLLRLPSKEWTDYAGAGVYGQLFAQGVLDAERKSSGIDMPVARKVRYGGVHRSHSLSRKKYGREIA